MGTRHGDSFWEEEKHNVGFKLMQNMGWSQGDGLGKNALGSTECLRVKRKNGTEGIGTKKEGRDETWTAATSAFNDLLKRLSSQGGNQAPDIDDEEEDAGNTTTTIKKYQARAQLYGKFKRAKDTKNYSSLQMNEIFGRRGDAPTAEERDTRSVPVDGGIKTTTNKKTINEYFQQRRTEQGGGSNAACAQERYYMEMTSIATSGRMGLGMSSAASAPGVRGSWDTGPQRPAQKTTVVGERLALASASKRRRSSSPDPLTTKKVKKAKEELSATEKIAMKKSTTKKKRKEESPRPKSSEKKKKVASPSSEDEAKPKRKSKKLSASDAGKMITKDEGADRAAHKAEKRARKLRKLASQ